MSGGGVGCDRSGGPGGRALWSAVVLQAKADVESAPLSSIDYSHAIAFLPAVVSGLMVGSTSLTSWACIRTNWNAAVAA